jgi:hypothetical protein
MASRVDCSEFDSAMGEFRGHFDDDYREFVLRYGGGLVGPLPIYGLRKAPSMGTISGNGTASEITKWFRRMRWPGVEDWLIFCVDQGGNPIGFARDRTVWLSDQTNFPQIVQLGSGFEDFLLKWCLLTRNVQ